jgi:hypothetical protein
MRIQCHEFSFTPIKLVTHIWQVKAKYFDPRPKQPAFYAFAKLISVRYKMPFTAQKVAVRTFLVCGLSDMAENSMATMAFNYRLSNNDLYDVVFR